MQSYKIQHQSHFANCALSVSMSLQAYDDLGHLTVASGTHFELGRCASSWPVVPRRGPVTVGLTIEAEPRRGRFFVVVDVD